MEKFRAEVTGIREMVWSSNGMEFETEAAAKEWLDGLSMRWFGFDLARVVPAETPRGEAVNFETDSIYLNFRK